MPEEKSECWRCFDKSHNWHSATCERKSSQFSVSVFVFEIISELIFSFTSIDVFFSTSREVFSSASTIGAGGCITVSIEGSLSTQIRFYIEGELKHHQLADARAQLKQEFYSKH